MKFAPGIIEADATKTNVTRSDKMGNTHNGRFIVTVSRETGESALTPLVDRMVKKGAPPPPETTKEVCAALTKHLSKDHLLSTDSAPAYKAHCKTQGMKHITVVHRTKNFVKQVRLPVKDLSKALQKKVKSMPTSNTRTMRVHAGDQAAEWTFAAIKRNVKRLNLQSSTTRASTIFWPVRGYRRMLA